MLNIGRIQTTHHLDGALKVSSAFNDFDKILGEKVILEKNSRTEILTIKSIKKINAKKYIINFEEIDNIDKAKELIGYDIKVRRNLLPQATKDDYYISDLITFNVIENGKNLGEVIDFLETAGHDILIINHNNKEVMIPFVEDVYIKLINFEKREIEVSLIEGIL